MQYPIFSFQRTADSNSQQLTNEYRTQIQDIINIGVSQMISKIYQTITTKIAQEELATYVIKGVKQHFQHQLTDSQILKIIVETFMRKQVSQLQLQIGFGILKGTNYLGSLLSQENTIFGLKRSIQYNNWLESLAYLITEQHSNILLNMKIDYFFTSLLKQDYNKNSIKAAIQLRNIQKARSKKLPILKYVQRFDKYQIQKQKYNAFIQNQLDIDYFIKNCKQFNIDYDNKTKIIKLYQNYIKVVKQNDQSYFNNMQTNSTQMTINFMCYLLNQQKHNKALFSSKINEEIIEINEDQSNDQIINITALRQLQSVSKNAQNIKRMQIWLSLDRNFTVNQISQQLIQELFNNIENRLLMIYSNQQFFIFKQISDNNIIKKDIQFEDETYTKKQLEQAINQLQTSEQYDVIVNGINFQNIGSLKIRYLNYTHFKIDTLSSNTNLITLQHPAMLVSLSLIRCKIKNLNQCTSLINLYSIDNIYQKNDIYMFKNLKHLSSENDQYISSVNDEYMVQILFQSNCLEYLNIIYGKNIINSCVLNKNIKFLRYFNVKTSLRGTDIKIDASNEFPKHLTVAKLTIVDQKTFKRDEIMIKIQGVQSYVERFEKQLTWRK